MQYECLRSANGSDYNGTKSISISGFKCKNWTDAVHACLLLDKKFKIIAYCRRNIKHWKKIIAEIQIMNLFLGATLQTRTFYGTIVILHLATKLLTRKVSHFNDEKISDIFL